MDLGDRETGTRAPMLRARPRRGRWQRSSHRTGARGEGPGVGRSAAPVEGDSAARAWIFRPSEPRGPTTAAHGGSRRTAGRGEEGVKREGLPKGDNEAYSAHQSRPAGLNCEYLRDIQKLLVTQMPIAAGTRGSDVREGSLCEATRNLP